MQNFQWFSPKTIKFFSELKENNNKKWFDENRKTYEEYVKKPLKLFFIDLWEKLLEKRPHLNFDSKKSIFRINRDIRFSKDKTPYKVWMSFALWEGPYSKAENPWFYFCLWANDLDMWAGNYWFNKEMLEKFREKIAWDESESFKKLMNKLKKKWYEIKGKHYKRYPRWYTEESKNAEYLLYNGIFIFEKYWKPKEIYSKDLVDFCAKKYDDYMELQEWLVKNLIQW